MYGDTVLENLVQAIELAGPDIEWLQAYVVAVGSNPDLLQVAVVDGSNRYLAHTLARKRGGNATDLVGAPDFSRQKHLLLTDPHTEKRFFRIMQGVETPKGLDKPAAVFLDVLSTEPVVWAMLNEWGGTLLVVSGLFGAAMVVVFVFLDRRVVRVVKALQIGANRIAQGSFDERIPIFRNDELGGLAYSFNRMTEELGKITVSKEFFDNILRSMAESLMILDSALTVQKVNRATCDLLGYSEQELLGKKFTSLVSNKDLSSANGGQEALLEDMSKTIEMELHYLTKDNQVVPVLFSGAPLTSGSGNLEGIVCVARDISELKRTEEHIRQMNVSLLAANQELKATQSQLVQSAKLASLGEMATGIAHELNQPLQIIGMSAELGTTLLEMEDREGGQEKFDKILQQVKRASAIINHLRSFARDAADDTRTLQDVNSIIETALSMFREQFRLRGIKIHHEAAVGLPQVFCNPIQIEQVITNLLMNAKDAMEQSSEKNIVVRSTSLNNKVIVEVEDTGSGMDSTLLSKVFDPFFTTKSIGKGTGLGLSISYGIVHDHHGSLEVESTKNVGTVFKIILPAYEGAGDAHSLC